MIEVTLCKTDSYTPAEQNVDFSILKNSVSDTNVQLSDLQIKEEKLT